MRRLATTGSLPTEIQENTAPWEWMGVLQLLSNPGAVRFVETDGFGANFFHASLNPVTGLIFITPHARLDYEWFATANLPPVVDFHLQFIMQDGTIARSDASFTVNVLDIDDTPPQDLYFITGGSVRAGVPGASVGQLKVVDPDTVSGFTFELAEDNSWQFEIVGNELRLRPGVQMDLTDGPVFPVIVTVSDGRQSQAFRLDVDVLPDPAVGTKPVDVLAPGEARKGFYHTSIEHVGTYFAPWEIASVTRAADLVRIDTIYGTDIWFRSTRYIDFTTGSIEFSETGTAAHMWLVFQTVFDRAPQLWEMRYFHDQVSSWGVGIRNVVDWALNYSGASGQFSRMDNNEFVKDIYSNIVSWNIGAGTIAWHAGRIDAGIISRIDFVMSMMDWRRPFGDFKAAVADGFYVPRANMEEIGSLISVAAGWKLSAHVWQWWSAWRDGTFDIFGLSQQIAQHPDFFSRWGHMDNREFADVFYQQMTGRPLGNAELETITWWLDSETGQRHEFMAHAAQQITDASIFRTLPQGAMFDVIW